MSGDRELRFDVRTGAQVVARPREPGNRYGLDVQRDHWLFRRGNSRQRENGQGKQGQTGGCSAHQFSPLLMDRSASIRVAPEPSRSGDIEIPRLGNMAI